MGSVTSPRRQRPGDTDRRTGPVPARAPRRSEQLSSRTLQDLPRLEFSSANPSRGTIRPAGLGFSSGAASPSFKTSE